ncbi:branched-chain amino acid ABC transporter substrate-binding protein [Thioclava sp. SK-1]|nr:branched-chain amino acid ABC transporter substrate-binding protein [Thioclava sp. SK-1]
MRSFLAASCLVAASSTQAIAVDIRIDWLEHRQIPPPILSNLQPDPLTLGIDGARLGLADISTTGKFTGHSYHIVTSVVAPEDDFIAAARQAVNNGAQLLIVDAPTDDLLALADMVAGRDVVIFNVSDSDDALRDAQCRSNVLHTTPSRRMRADALAQFLLWRRWDDLVMVAGTSPDDIAWADAMRAALHKFGLQIAAEKIWSFDANMRRAATAEVPLFTQALPDHDLMLVADEAGDFARYLAYNTWLARPLAGSEGLQPVAWSDVVEQHGAAQLQNRFREATGRAMRADDFGAWAAVAALGEAVTRTGSADPAELRAYMLSDAFRLAGFLGTPLSFRDWNGQLRQPIPLVTERAVTALAPIEGFLHQFNELDTLGADRPESQCTSFKEPT